MGSPLSACVEAQAQAACATANFIQSVGLCKKNTDTKKEGSSEQEEKFEAVTVEFSFMRGGNEVIVKVPLLTIVPIPYFAISTVDINFKATITGIDTTHYEQNASDTYDSSEGSSKRRGFIFNRNKTTLKTTVSSKKDSKATQDSSFSIESTIDVSVHAVQDSMPAGMAKMLEILNSAVSAEQAEEKKA
ncbi:MAG: DUF2589 domain-containing protein [Paludibacteraceae bacterium]|nr:DUF2589 domain-containing protein [Paludibacteraceae bacterium]